MSHCLCSDVKGGHNNVETCEEMALVVCYPTGNKVCNKFLLLIHFYFDLFSIDWCFKIIFHLLPQSENILLLLFRCRILELVLCGPIKWKSQSFWQLQESIKVHSICTDFVCIQFRFNIQEFSFEISILALSFCFCFGFSLHENSRINNTP